MMYSESEETQMTLNAWQWQACESEFIGNYRKECVVLHNNTGNYNWWLAPNAHTQEQLWLAWLYTCGEYQYTNNMLNLCSSELTGRSLASEASKTLLFVPLEIWKESNHTINNPERFRKFTI